MSVSHDHYVCVCVQSVAMERPNAKTWRSCIWEMMAGHVCEEVVHIIWIYTLYLQYTGTYTSLLICSKLFIPSSPPLSSPQGQSSETSGWGDACLSVCSLASPSSGVDFSVSFGVWWFSVSERVLLTPGSRVAIKWGSSIKIKIKTEL